MSRPNARNHEWKKRKVREKYLGERCPKRQKRSFLNKRAADEHAERLTRTLKELVTSYLCEECGRWHVGHEPDPVGVVFGGAE